jgi:DNA helicase HerA-like ATPase
MHALICGVTQSGKTTLAHSMAQMLAGNGERIIVYDPVGTQTVKGNWPVSAVTFSDEHEFFEYLSRDDVNNAYIFIDEAGDIFTPQKRENLWLLTRGRHFGFSVFMIAQRPKMILPSARSMAGACYMFRLSADDQRDIGRDFGHNGLDKINLDRGDFLMVISGSSTFERGNVFSLV